MNTGRVCNVVVALLTGFTIGMASAKLPAPSDEQKAKTAEAKAKADEAAKKDAEALAKSQDRAAEHYRKAKGAVTKTSASK